MNFNREEAIKAISNLSDETLVRLLVKNYMFRGVTNDIEEAVETCSHSDDTMIHPTSEDLFNELIKFTKTTPYGFNDEELYYNDHTYVYLSKDYYSGDAYISHRDEDKEGYNNIITLTK